jgi:hypothetical protein
LRPLRSYRWQYHRRIAQLRVQFPDIDMPPTCDSYHDWNDLEVFNGALCKCHEVWQEADSMSVTEPF